MTSFSVLFNIFLISLFLLFSDHDTVIECKVLVFYMCDEFYLFTSKIAGVGKFRS